MALSGSYTQTMTRTELIKDALVLLGVHDATQDVKSVDSMVGSRRLNLILGHWRNFGIQLWKQKHCAVILEKDKQQYALGPSSTSDHFTTYDDLARTTLSAAAASGASTITVDSITGITNADTLLIELDDGTFEEETVNGAPSGSTVTLTSTLASAAASGNAVFAYASRAQRPQRILEATRRDTSDHEIPVTVVGTQEFHTYPDKFESSYPHTVSYKPTLTDGELRVYPPASSANLGETLELLVEYPFQLFADAADEPDVPPEGHFALVYALAESLGIDYHTDSDTMARIRRAAKSTFDEFLAADQERLVIRFEPRYER
jgi:hypothetical protein